MVIQVLKYLASQHEAQLDPRRFNEFHTVIRLLNGFLENYDCAASQKEKSVLSHFAYLYSRLQQEIFILVLKANAILKVIGIVLIKSVRLAEEI